MRPLRDPAAGVEVHLRLALCLAHTVPDATCALRLRTGDRWVVARERPDATLDPCQARHWALAERRPGVPHLTDLVVAVGLGGSLVDLGVGLFQRVPPLGREERWFAAALPGDRIAEVVDDCPLQMPDGAVQVHVTPDDELGTSAVRVVTAAGFAHLLDESAFWLLARCMVEEVLAAR